MRIDSYDIRVETWPLLTPFRISRGAKTQAQVVSVALQSGKHIGRGEGCPYGRYGETADDVAATLCALDLNTLDVPDLRAMRKELRRRLPAGSALNALDCALWDLEAKSCDTTVWRLASLPEPQPLVTCFTLSLDKPEAMAAAAREHADCPLLKLKLGDEVLDADRMLAVRQARPEARLVADANEGWSSDNVSALLLAASTSGFELMEQPLPAADDWALAQNLGVQSLIPVCADEAAAPGSSLADLANRYQAVNIKLDKTGGLTGAIAAIKEARSLGLKVMIGSMVSTSLSMAPAALLGGLADWVDLDSPLLLADDRQHAMSIETGVLSPPSPELWG